MVPIVLGLVCVLFAVAQRWTRISPFVARKLTHIGSGFIIYYCNRTEAERTLVLLVCAAVPALTWGMPLRFTNPGGLDIGISLFALTVGAFALYRVDLRLLSPLLFADPIAALIGRNVQSPRLWGAKTVAGCSTFFLVSLLTLSTVLDAGGGGSLFLALACTAAEAVSGDFDNVCIGVVVGIFKWLESGIRTVPV